MVKLIPKKKRKKKDGNRRELKMKKPWWRNGFWTKRTEKLYGRQIRVLQRLVSTERGRFSGRPISDGDFATALCEEHRKAVVWDHLGQSIHVISRRNPLGKESKEMNLDVVVCRGVGSCCWWRLGSWIGSRHCRRWRHHFSLSRSKRLGFNFWSFSFLSFSFIWRENYNCSPYCCFYIRFVSLLFVRFLLKSWHVRTTQYPYILILKLPSLHP